MTFKVYTCSLIVNIEINSEHITFVLFLDRQKYKLWTSFASAQNATVNSLACLNGQITRCMLLSFCLLSVHPSIAILWSISQKLNEIDPWLLMITIQKLALQILLPHSYPPLDAPWWWYSGFKCWNNMFKCSCSTSALEYRCCQHSETVISPQMLSTACNHRNLLSTLIVRCVDNTCGMTQKSNRRRPAF